MEVSRSASKANESRENVLKRGQIGDLGLEKLPQFSLPPAPGDAVNRTISRNETSGQQAKENALLRTALTSAFVTKDSHESNGQQAKEDAHPDTAPTPADHSTGSIEIYSAGIQSQIAAAMHRSRTLVARQEQDAPIIHTDNYPSGNHALLDYQTQLMLLEQQNKKRLLMARLEQDELPEAHNVRPKSYQPLLHTQGKAPHKQTSLNLPRLASHLHSNSETIALATAVPQLQRAVDVGTSEGRVMAQHYVADDCQHGIGGSLTRQTDNSSAEQPESLSSQPYSPIHKPNHLPVSPSQSMRATLTSSQVGRRTQMSPQDTFAARTDGSRIDQITNVDTLSALRYKVQLMQSQMHALDANLQQVQKQALDRDSHSPDSQELVRPLANLTPSLDIEGASDCDDLRVDPGMLSGRSADILGVPRGSPVNTTSWSCATPACSSLQLGYPLRLSQCGPNAAEQPQATAANLPVTPRGTQEHTLIPQEQLASTEGRQASVEKQRNELRDTPQRQKPTSPWGMTGAQDSNYTLNRNDNQDRHGESSGNYVNGMAMRNGTLDIRAASTPTDLDQERLHAQGYRVSSALPAASVDPRNDYAASCDGESHDSQIFEMQQYMAQLKAENALLKTALKRSDTAELWPVLHRVECQDEDQAVTYMEIPMLTGSDDDEHRHLSGHRRVANEAAWEGKAKDTPFVVYLTYQCHEGSAEQQKQRSSGYRKTRPMMPEEAEKPRSEEVHILSVSLLSTLEDLFANNHPLDEYADVISEDTLYAPYPFFFHFESSFIQHLSQLDGTILEEFGLLVRYLQQHTSQSSDSIRATLDSGYVTPDLAQYLFAPGNLLITQHAEETPARILRQTSALSFDSSESHDRRDGEGKNMRRWDLHFIFIRFDGKFWWSTARTRLSMKSDEPTAITDLPVYPLKYAKDSVRESMLRRGRRFRACSGGLLVDSRRLGESGHKGASTSRYMVDVQAFRTLYPHEALACYDPPHDSSLVSLNQLEPIEPIPDHENFLLVLPGSITAFHMDDKKWVTLNVDDIADGISWNKEAFENLVIESEAKEMIEALVRNKIESDRSIDFVKGKGTGLIILLHGGPGTGKTLTAESVAEIAEKPLYRVTCGDVGIDPVKVEDYLESVFYLGRRWKSVVLLDEADVFLQQRDLDNLARNSLVSVFLRTLEYYDGILVLTSNRVGIFDEAFKSRIQLALYYPNLSVEQRAQIWSNFINRLATFEDVVDVEGICQHIAELAKEPMNGRQIRNSINNARGLAKSKGQCMDVTHLQRAIRLGQRFEEYLVEMKGAGDEDFAREDGVRM